MTFCRVPVMCIRSQTDCGNALLIRRLSDQPSGVNRNSPMYWPCTSSTNLGLLPISAKVLSALQRNVSASDRGSPKRFSQSWSQLGSYVTARLELLDISDRTAEAS